MTQGAPTNALDLDALLVSRSLKPGKVRFGGRTWTVNRSFTGADIVKYWALANARKDVEAFTMLVGAEDAEAFASLISALPVESAAPVLRALYKTAGVLKRENDDEDQEGESSAS